MDLRSKDVLLELCNVPTYQWVVSALERAIRKLGHEVHYWKRGSPINEGCVIVWWGCNVTPRQHEAAARAGATPIYLERGWTSDRDCNFQLDFKGVGGLASWAEEPLKWPHLDPLKLRNRGGPILVCLRYEREFNYTDNVQQLSPWFKDNSDLLHFIYKARSPLAHGEKRPMRIRPHPVTSARKNQDCEHPTRAWGWEWDTSPDFQTAVRDCCAVAVIDSTAGVWALEQGLPVLCFGKQVYRQPGAVYCLDRDRQATTNALQELGRYECSLNTGAVGAVLSRIRQHQWDPHAADGFPERLRIEFGL